MKKTSIYIAFAAAAVLVAVLAVSCVRELEYPRSVYGDRAVLRLTPVCEDLATKAEIAGDTKYNETKIANYYWFIYADTTGTPGLSGYVGDGSDKIIPLDTQFPIQSGDGYVYVVANLPEKPETPVKGDEWFEWDNANQKIKHFVQGETSASSDKSYGPAIANLRTISFGKNTPLSSSGSIAAGQSEFYRYTSSTTGVPAPERFVMRLEEPVKFRIDDLTTSVEVTASLTRIAAKIVLDLYVAKEVEQTKTLPSGLEDYVKTWNSDISHIQVYMLWGSTHGDLNGTPIHYGDQGVNPSWFYSASPRYAMYRNPDGGEYDITIDAIRGSVPESLYTLVEKEIESTVWEVVYQRQWIWNDDVGEDEKTIDNQGDDNYGHWEDILDENGNKIPVVGPDGNVQRKLAIKTETKEYYQISSLPLYTMPISWNVNDAHAPFIKVILPWQGYDKKTGKPDAKTTEFYYKILIPEMTKLDANNCYHIKLDLSVLGSSADEVPVEVSGKYHVVPWADPAEMGGPQTAGRFLDVASELEFFTQSAMEIPVRSSHDIEVVSTGTYAPVASYNNYSDDNVITSYLTLDATSTTGDNYTIAASSREKVTITHYQQTNLDLMKPRDVARIVYTFRIQHKGYPTIYKDVKVTQYPSSYIMAYTNTGDNTPRNAAGQERNTGQYRWGYVFVNTTSNSFNNGTSGSGWYLVNLLNKGGSGQGQNSNPNMYVVTSKILASTNQIIGDPRIQAGVASNGWIITDFTGTAPASGWETAPALSGTSPRRLSKGYLMAESSDRTLNMVAPGLRVASSFGARRGNMGFEDATRRCAAYQEDGYPAGRWRLPTAAEIQYLTNLTARELMPLLFGAANTSIDYWSANGYCTINNQNNTVTVYNGDFSGTRGIRCVYDEWYWGSETLSDKNVFTWGDLYAE